MVGPGDPEQGGSVTPRSRSPKAGTGLPGCLAPVAPALQPPFPPGPSAGVFGQCMRLWRAPVTSRSRLDLCLSPSALQTRGAWVLCVLPAGLPQPEKQAGVGEA